MKVTVFWDVEDALLIEFAPKAITITGNVYKGTIKNLKAAADPTSIIMHDYCRLHKARIVQETVGECGFEELQHAPYHLYFAPPSPLYEHYFVLKLKKLIRGSSNF